MKRIIMRDTITKKYAVITKSIQNDCFVNKNRVDNIGFYELVDSYKKAGYKILRCYSGTVNEWGNMCDMNNLTSELSIYDRYNPEYGKITDYKMVLQKVIHVLTIAIKANSTSAAEKMLLRTIISDICRYAVVNWKHAPGYVKYALKHLKNVEETPAIIVLKRDLEDLLG